MSIKSITRIVLAIFCLTIALTVCSCTLMQGDIMQEITNIKEFATDISDTVSAVSDPNLTNEEKIAKAEELIHPDSDITLESIMEDIKTNEKLQGLTSANDVQIVEMPNLEDLATIAQYDEELGGFVYNADLTVSVDGTLITVDLTLFSNDKGMGVYNYEIK